MNQLENLGKMILELRNKIKGKKEVNVSLKIRVYFLLDLLKIPLPTEKKRISDDCDGKSVQAAVRNNSKLYDSSVH